MKSVAIYSGGDWADASCEIIDIDSAIDVKEKKQEYEKWYNYVYIPAYRRGEKPKYLSFVGWLKHFCGAKESEKVEEFWG